MSSRHPSPSLATDRFSVFLPGETMFLRVSGRTCPQYVQFGSRVALGRQRSRREEDGVRWTSWLPVDLPAHLSQQEVEDWLTKCFPGATVVWYERNPKRPSRASGQAAPPASRGTRRWKDVGGDGHHAGHPVCD